MGTVKYYKDLGLEFVDGDAALDCKMNQIGANSVNRNDNFDDETVKEFAWRTNTGEKPSYKGMVEVMGRGGEYVDVGSAGEFSWVLDYASGDIVRWRPVIAKEDKMEGFNSRCVTVNLKPTYTKEMDEAGELPPIGSEVEICNIEDADCRFPEIKEGDKLICIAHTLDNDTTHNLGVYQKRGMAVSIRPAYIRPIDTRTDEEKLIDELIEDVDTANPDHKLGVALNSLAAQLIAMGYRKP